MAIDRVNAMAATKGMDDPSRVAEPAMDAMDRIADVTRLLGAPRVATMATAMAALAAAQITNTSARIPVRTAPTQISPVSRARTIQSPAAIGGNSHFI
jgi:predicted secreted protein